MDQHHVAGAIVSLRRNDVAQLPDAGGVLPDDLVTISREGRWRKYPATAFISSSGFAPLASPAFTGTVTAPAVNFGTSTEKFLVTTTAHLAMGGKSNPVNAWVYIGSGTGSMTDQASSVGGLKVKLNADSVNRRPHGVTANINIVSGATNGLVLATMGRIDINDTTSTGDTVAVWGDTFVRVATPRNSWGGNIYNEIGDAANPGLFAYNGVGVGLEVGLNNYSTVANSGVILSLVSHGTNTVRAAVLLKSGGNPDTFGNNPNTGVNATGNVEHFLLAADDTAQTVGGIAGRGPGTNLIYYGPLGPSNAPFGAAKFVVNKAGDIASAGKLGVNGSTPVGKQTLSAALATDGTATNAQISTAINNIRAALIAIGMGQ